MCEISDGVRQATGVSMEMTLPLGIGDMQIHWLGGGDFRLDGGTMFGPVPKVLWQKRYPADALNTIHMCNDPLLVKTPDTLLLIDSGLGNKLTDKQNSIFQVSPPWDLPSQLGLLGISREDVDLVILTHCDFDHAGGIEMINADGGRELTFPRATHLIQETETWRSAPASGCVIPVATPAATNWSRCPHRGKRRCISAISVRPMPTSILSGSWPMTTFP